MRHWGNSDKGSHRRSRSLHRVPLIFTRQREEETSAQVQFCRVRQGAAATPLESTLQERFRSQVASARRLPAKDCLQNQGHQKSHVRKGIIQVTGNRFFEHDYMVRLLSFYCPAYLIARICQLHALCGMPLTFLCKKTKESCGMSEICRNFAAK